MAQAIPGVQEDPSQKQPNKYGRPGHQSQQQNRPAQPKAGRDDNMIFVGKKPTMSYVLAVMTQLQNGTNDIHLKARGKSISRAVDVAEVVKNRFMQDIKREIIISTEQIEDRENNTINVSTIDIRMMR